MKSAKLISSALTMLLCFVTMAQQKTITGIVSDNSGPLPGANVVVKGTTRGVQTNLDGKYAIQASVGETLVYSFIGLEDQSKKVGQQNVINVKLNASSLKLSEVVVEGYGYTKTKAKTMGATQTVSSQTIQGRANVNTFQSLQGQLAGANIAMSSGQPGTNKTDVVIRGLGTTSTNNDPLYVVNGVPVKSADFKNINPNELESVNVLKDASASSIYGNRGSNGVIVITTKNGILQNLTQKEINKKLKEIEKHEDKLAHEEPTQEDYDSFVENAFESPKMTPLSTFSIDVDNASYTNIRRFINNGQTVPKDAVRVEEMMNFFKYQYPQPQSEHPFSITTEYSECPWNPNNKLVRIGLQGKNIPSESLPASNLVFLIDVSGSMSDMNKLPLVKESLKALVAQLRDEDKIAIVVYAGAAGLVLPSTSGSDKQTIINALDKLNSGGSTAGGAGIQLAYKTAEEHFIKGGNNRVILATDGDFNVGASSDSDMQTLIEDKRKSGVFLTCLGYGMGNYKDSKLETLADKGNGNYAYIDSIQEANRFLVKEFKGSMYAIAKDVKIQIEFNPANVQAYRLIGYENRKLRPEDFVNDTIDAGELGSGHTVTALYEIIAVGSKSDTNSEPIDLKYSKVAATGTQFSNELATIKFRYKKPDGDKSIEMVNVIANKAISPENASADFKFCSAVAWFGLKLRDSKLISNSKTEDIKKLAKEGLAKDTEGYKAEFIRLIEGAKVIAKL
jgi:Ca-activated chloride channel family protein